MLLEAVLLVAWLQPAAALHAPAAPEAPAAAVAEATSTRADPGHDDPLPPGALEGHYLAGVLASLAGIAGSYALATVVGHQGSGLGPPIVGLLIGALLPPLIVATAQWASWSVLAPGRDRVWPAYAAAFAVHLAFFVGAVLGGLNLHDGAEAAGLVLSEAVVLPLTTTAITYLTRRPGPDPLPPPAPVAPPSTPPAPVPEPTPGRTLIPLVGVSF